jgi:hypothetical protein
VTPVRALETDWRAGPPGAVPFDSSRLSHLPEPARRYLRHAIAEGTPLASAVRLRMRGEIRIGRWLPFRAEQVLQADGGMLWQARARMHGLPVTGFDRLVEGRGEMRWKLLGLFTVVAASGPDISSSARGRVAAESVWLPSVLTAPGVEWASEAADHARAGLWIHGQRSAVDLEVDADGSLRSLRLQRWGNPEGREFHFVDFGGRIEAEATFGGYTIPTRLRIGWHFGTDRFESDGEFFRAEVEDARFR